jgi:hypothetical protein
MIRGPVIAHFDKEEESAMTRICRRITLTTVLASFLLIYPQARGADEKTFQGEIADTQCALNVHSLSQSHKEMIEMKAAGKTNADCARFCVKERGGRFVLQTKTKVYRLDKQGLAERNAGLIVKVTGILDPKSETITIHSMKPIAPPEKESRPK